MRIPKSLKADLEIISRLITALSSASVEVRGNKRAKPKLFIIAHEFISGYVHKGFFVKEELLVKILQDAGFPSDEGPIGAMRADQKKSLDISEALIHTAKQWEAGDEEIRIELGWASSESASALRQHLDRLRSLIFPLLEQTISVQEEDRISDAIKNASGEGELKDDAEKYIKMLDDIEEELSNWK